MLNLESQFNEFKEYIDSVRKAEIEIPRREKALEAYVEERKLKQGKVNVYTFDIKAKKENTFAIPII